MIDAIDNALGVRAIGRFIYNHFKFMFTVSWLYYLTLVVMSSYNEAHLLKEIRWELGCQTREQDYEMNKKFQAINKINEERHQDSVDYKLKMTQEKFKNYLD